MTQSIPRIEESRESDMRGWQVQNHQNQTPVRSTWAINIRLKKRLTTKSGRVLRKSRPGGCCKVRARGN